MGLTNKQDKTFALSNMTAFAYDFCLVCTYVKCLIWSRIAILFLCLYVSPSIENKQLTQKLLYQLQVRVINLLVISY
jgi:hypothetical protein